MFGASCSLNTAMTAADFANDQLRWSLFDARAPGNSFILVPVSAHGHRGAAQGLAGIAGASGLFNMMRNLGGSIGIALLSALLTVREQFHSNRLGEAVSSTYNSAARRNASPRSRKTFHRRPGSDAFTAGRQAVAALDAVVRREATLMAFNDCFYVLGLVLISATIAAFFSRPGEGGGRGRRALMSAPRPRLLTSNAQVPTPAFSSLTPYT